MYAGNDDFIEAQYNDEAAANHDNSNGFDGESYGNNVDDSTEEWTQYNDDDGNPYWYNNHTGISQYEDPYL